jgi:hypothetical protein
VLGSLSFAVRPMAVDIGGRLIYRALKRILLPSLSSPIFFCDVILADILTSFAKVLGDLWVSGCQVWFGGITHGRVSQSGWSRWVTLGMVWYVLLVYLAIYFHISTRHRSSLSRLR